MLPILTFDERRLTPSLGYVFDPRWVEPYESIVGILWRFVRTNALAGHVVVTQLSRQPVDPYAGIDISLTEVDVRGLAGLLGLTRKVLQLGICPPSGVRAMSRRLRRCPRCISLGYHSVVHQAIAFARCPAHDDWLEERCCTCGRESPYRLDARVLGAPFRCTHCRQPYGRRVPTISPRPLPKHVRTAITRAWLG